MNSAEILKQVEKRIKIVIDVAEAEKELLAEKKIVKETNPKDAESQLFNIWLAETFIKIIKRYENAFSLLKKRDYYKAWCEYERLDVSFVNLRDNNVKLEKFKKICFINLQYKRFQDLYPYRLFLSTEILNKKETCSICGKVINPVTPCGHIVGKVYNGELCYSIVEDLDFLGSAIVQNPVNKYSVLFADIENPEKYEALEYLIPKLKTPYDLWGYNKVICYEDYSKYKDTKDSDFCPCFSGKKFYECCKLTGKGIAYPHFDFYFGKLYSEPFSLNDMKL